MKGSVLGFVFLTLISPSYLQTCSNEECKDTIVAVIGPTGVGKSSFCNLISGVDQSNSQTYPVCDGIDSCTYKTTWKRVQWMGNGQEFILLDTPGLGDSEGRDSKHIDEMTEELRNLKYVNAFLIMFNAANPRLDEFLQAQLKIFVKIFGPGFFKNVIMVFNRWEYHSRAEEKRKRTGLTSQSLSADFNNKFRTMFGVKHTIQAYFIDTYPDPEYQEEMSAINNQLIKMNKEIANMPPFKCEDIEAVRGFVDNLTNIIEEKDTNLKEARDKIRETNERLEETEKQKLEAERYLKEQKVRNEEREASRERERQRERESEKARQQARQQARDENKKDDSHWWWTAAIGAIVGIGLRAIIPIPIPGI